MHGTFPTSNSDRRRPAWVRGLGLTVAAGLVSLIAGCRHEMYDQPRFEPQEASTFFADGEANRPLELGVVPREASPTELRTDLHLYKGKVDGKDAETLPKQIEFNHELLVRGQGRYRIYCTPCHGELGNGKGMIVQRGFTPPPPFYGSYVSKSLTGPVPTYNDLREAPLGHFFEVISNGHGAMYSYASRVAVKDRWAIATYIRALQFSQSAGVDELKGIKDPTDDERRLVQEAGR